MQSKWRLLFVLGAVIALAMAFTACGDDDDGGDTGGDTGATGATGVPEEFVGPNEPPADAVQGGDLKVLASGDVDYMDPGAAYYQFSYMIMNAMHRNLLTWAPDDSDLPTPDGATEEPEISEDDQKLTFTIREGMKFAPPVNREITAADYEYAIERALLPGIANGYAFYLADIVGFEAAQKEAADNPTGGAPDIKGVTATDDYTLEIELDRPTAYVVGQALSLPISAPVPEEFAKEFDAENPSTYGDHVIASGPYMVENNAEGELTGYTSGREIKLVRNPNWDAESDPIRPAYLDTIEIQEGFNDTASAARKVLSGEATISGDFIPPPSVLKEAATEGEPGQLTLTPSGGNRYIGLNTQEPPFDDINVRKAVIANSDREALRNTRGGELIGPVATHILPPLFPGFEEAGGVEGDPSLDYLATPTGDPDLAAEYMKKAGFESGQCEGDDCKITMVGDDVSPGKDTAEVFRGQLEELGFDVTFRPVDHDIMYTRFCSIPEQQPEVCPNVGWLKDFLDAQSMIQITFSGDAIDPENNSNWAQLDVPEINQAIDEATLINDPDERAQRWGEIDLEIMGQAPVVPWVWDNQPNVKSADVVGVIHLFNASWDLSSTSLSG